ncbi:MAG: hypothetical protein KAG70_05630, partial [Alcanivorax sp.]|nr:hypothetical protein [Alcanivorax sp.]
MLIKRQSFSVLFVATLLLVGCDNNGSSSDDSAGIVTERGVTPSQPQNLDRSCDEAAYPSAKWTACEAANYAKGQEATTEQLSPDFDSRWVMQSAANLQAWTERSLADPSWLSPLAGNTPVTPLCTTWSLQCTGDPFRYPT